MFLLEKWKFLNFPYSKKKWKNFPGTAMVCFHQVEGLFVFLFLEGKQMETTYLERLNGNEGNHRWKQDCPVYLYFLFVESKKWRIFVEVWKTIEIWDTTKNHLGWYSLCNMFTYIWDMLMVCMIMICMVLTMQFIDEGYGSGWSKLSYRWEGPGEWFVGLLHHNRRP